MVHFPEDRASLVGEEFEKPYFLSLTANLKERKAAGENIYPAWADIFRAFRATPIDKVKVIILWQDPYHGAGQAHGLSFSVPDGVALPPSLRNIYKELIDEFGGTMPLTGNLTHRTEQGVLLLNAILTVTAWFPASHHGLWREQFTDSVIGRLSEEKQWLVFLLRGSFAKSKKPLIDTTKHLVLEAAHPSPFSAHSGFFWCTHFLQTNKWLEEQWKEPIAWL
jgi:uracil-DNA glycosylase